MLLLVSLVVLSQTATTSDDWAEIDFRVSAGAEWDSNAQRTVSGSEVSDGLARLVLDTRGQFHILDAHQLRASYVLGAKRYIAEEEEDLLVHSLTLSSAHRITNWLVGGLWGALFTSRVRHGNRDYSLKNAGITATFLPHRDLDIRLLGNGSDFVSGDNPDYSFAGPEVGIAIAWRPFERFTLSARVDRSWRYFDGNALVRGRYNVAPDGEPEVIQERPTFCKDRENEIVPGVCIPRERDDIENSVTVRARYRGTVVIAGGEYLLRAQRSTSDYENIDRHRLSAFATFRLPFALVANLRASIQLNNGVSETDGLLFAEDDENQNSVQVQLSREITEELALELRYALFAYQFTTVDERFLRQTFYLGLSFQTGQ